MSEPNDDLMMTECRCVALICPRCKRTPGRHHATAASLAQHLCAAVRDAEGARPPRDEDDILESLRVQARSLAATRPAGAGCVTLCWRGEDGRLFEAPPGYEQQRPPEGWA